MPWARFESSFPDHPKVANLDNTAFRLYVMAVCYSAGYGTDGVLVRDQLERLLRRIPGRKNKSKAVAKLLDVGLFEPNSDGVTVHDFLDYNPSREQVLGKLKGGAERQKRYRERQRDDVTPSDSDGVTDASRNAVSNARPVPSLPYPRTDGGPPGDPEASGSSAKSNGSAPPAGCGHCEPFGTRVGFNRGTGKPCQCPLGLWRMREKQRTGKWPTGPDRPGDASPAPKRRREGTVLTPELQSELDALIELHGVDPNDEGLDQEIPV